jgi:hypothetical protein
MITKLLLLEIQVKQNKKLKLNRIHLRKTQNLVH